MVAARHSLCCVLALLCALARYFLRTQVLFDEILPVIFQAVYETIISRLVCCCIGGMSCYGLKVLLTCRQNIVQPSFCSRSPLSHLKILSLPLASPKHKSTCRRTKSRRDSLDKPAHGTKIIQDLRVLSDAQWLPSLEGVAKRTPASAYDYIERNACLTLGAKSDFIDAKPIIRADIYRPCMTFWKTVFLILFYTYKNRMRSCS